jgi:hypothetical protein
MGRYLKCMGKCLSGWWVDKFMENYAIMPLLRGFGLKNRIFGEFSLGKKV